MRVPKFVPLSLLLGGIFCAGPALAQNIESLASSNVFNGATINVGSQLDPAFHTAYFTDGSTLPFVFNDGDVQSVSFTSGTQDLQFNAINFFNTPQYASRQPSTVDIYYSSSTLSGSASVDPTNAAYTLLGSYSLDFNTATSPADFSPIGPPLNIDGSPPNQQIFFAGLSSLGMPVGEHSILLNFNIGEFGNGVSEITGTVPEPAVMGLVFGVAAIVCAGWRRRARS